MTRSVRRTEHPVTLAGILGLSLVVHASILWWLLERQQALQLAVEPPAPELAPIDFIDLPPPEAEVLPPEETRREAIEDSVARAPEVDLPSAEQAVEPEPPAAIAEPIAPTPPAIPEPAPIAPPEPIPTPVIPPVVEERIAPEPVEEPAPPEPLAEAPEPPRPRIPRPEPIAPPEPIPTPISPPVAEERPEPEPTPIEEPVFPEPLAAAPEPPRPRIPRPEPIVPPEPIPTPVPPPRVERRVPPEPIAAPPPAPIPRPISPPPVATPPRPTAPAPPRDIAAAPTAPPVPTTPPPAPATPAPSGGASLLAGTQARALESGGAGDFFEQPERGSSSVAALQNPDLGPYLRKIQRRVRAAWRPLNPNRERQTVLSIVLDRAGAISYIGVLRTSGSSQVDREALDAVRKAAPFGPFPDGYREPNLDIEFSFSIFIRNGRF